VASLQQQLDQAREQSKAVASKQESQLERSTAEKAELQTRIDELQSRVDELAKGGDEATRRLGEELSQAQAYLKIEKEKNAKEV
jgi:predicted RNase H-like nuclease (RuvC/YqgF family)